MFGSLYLKVFVNIVLKQNAVTVYIELLSKKNVVKSIEESFETKSINEKMLQFINNYINESPYHYIALLDSSSSQGAIPTCSKKLLGQYHDVSSSEYRCFEDKWSYFTSASNLTTLKRQYREIGLDFVFSPFVLMAEFFKDKVNGQRAMYVLIEENFLSIAIFENSELLFAKHLDAQSNKEDFDVMSYDEPIDLEFDIDESVDLEDVSVADYMEEVEDFSDIEDLDAFEEMDEFSEAKDSQEVLYQNSLNEVEESLIEGFNEDYQRFLLIQESLKNYYNDAQYISSFIETIYIADGVGISQDLKRFLEEEMFLSVYMRKIDLSLQVCELAKAELHI